jgi:hypothetical protein
MGAVLALATGPARRGLCRIQRIDQGRDPGQGRRDHGPEPREVRRLDHLADGLLEKRERRADRGDRRGSSQPLPEDAEEARAANPHPEQDRGARAGLDERIRVAEEQEARRRGRRRQQQARQAHRRPVSPVRSCPSRASTTTPATATSSTWCATPSAAATATAASRRARAAAASRQELAVELPAREAVATSIAGPAGRPRDAVAGISRRARENMFEKRVNPNRTDGQGGNFVPPLWLVDEYVDLPGSVGPRRTCAGRWTCPSGTDSINLPKVATGTATACRPRTPARSPVDGPDRHVGRRPGADDRRSAGHRDPAARPVADVASTRSSSPT